MFSDLDFYLTCISIMGLTLAPGFILATYVTQLPSSRLYGEKS